MDEYFDFSIYSINNPKKSEIIKADNVKVHILIYLPESQNKIENIEFLNKIIDSISINTKKNYVIVEVEDSIPIDINDDKQKFSPSFIIAFGIDIQSLSINAKLEQRNWNHFDTFSFMMFDEIEKVKNSADLKKNLWDKIKFLKDVQ